MFILMSFVFFPGMDERTSHLHLRTRKRMMHETNSAVTDVCLFTVCNVVKSPSTETSFILKPTTDMSMPLSLHPIVCSPSLSPESRNIPPIQSEETVEVCLEFKARVLLSDGSHTGRTPGSLEVVLQSSSFLSITSALSAPHQLQLK